MDFSTKPSAAGNTQDDSRMWKLISVSFVSFVIVLGSCILYLWIKLKSLKRKIRNPRNDVELKTGVPMLQINEPVDEPEQNVMENPNESQNVENWNLEYVNQIEENVYHTLGLGYITVPRVENRRNRELVIVKRSTNPEQQRVIRDELRYLTEGIERHPNLLTFIGHEVNGIVTQRPQLDLHHQAPELNSNENRFSEQSDVWSYAVSVWQLWTLGKTPYEGVENVEAFIENENRLPKPEYAHQEVYHYLLECWKREKLDRPTFSKITEFFENHMDSHGLQIKRQIDQKLEASRTVQEAMGAGI